MALGARPRSVYRLILGEVGRLVAAGTALGIGGSLAAARLIRGLFYGMSPWDISNRNNRICGSHLCLAICELLSGTSCGFRQRSRHVAFGVGPTPAMIVCPRPMTSPITRMSACNLPLVVGRYTGKWFEVLAGGFVTKSRPAFRHFPASRDVRISVDVLPQTLHFAGRDLTGASGT